MYAYGFISFSTDIMYAKNVEIDLMPRSVVYDLYRH